MLNKVCVLNFSGNVGKSVIGKHVMQTIIPDSRLVIIETRNATEGATNSIKLNAQYYEKIQEEIILAEKIILDVGSSNIEDFIDGVDKFAGSLDEFDLFIVPVVSDQKIQEDSIQTIMLLIDELEIPKKKIKVIFNRTKSNVDEEFKGFIGACDELGIIYDLNAILPETDLFSRMSDKDTIEIILNDKEDYRKLIREEKDDGIKQDYMRKTMLSMMVKGVKNKIDYIESYLNG